MGLPDLANTCIARPGKLSIFIKFPTGKQQTYFECYVYPKKFGGGIYTQRK